MGRRLQILVVIQLADCHLVLFVSDLNHAFCLIALFLRNGRLNHAVTFFPRLERWLGVSTRRCII